MIAMPKYNDKVDTIFSVVFTNIFTLGGCSLISLFGLDDIILCLLFWFQIIAANNNQGFLNKVYSYKWRLIDVTNAFLIGIYGSLNYNNIIPPIIEYPFFIILFLAFYSQSTSESMYDYIFQVNIWHLLVFFYILMIFFFKNEKTT